MFERGKHLMLISEFKDGLRPIATLAIGQKRANFLLFLFDIKVFRLVANPMNGFINQKSCSF